MTLGDGVGAGLVPMSKETRAHALRERMELLGVGVQRLAVEANYNRKTVSRALEGSASDRTYQDLEEALEAIKLRIDGPDDAPEAAQEEPAKNVGEGLVSFKLKGIYGAAEVIVEGPVENLADLEAAAERLLRGGSGEGK